MAAPLVRTKVTETSGSAIGLALATTAVTLLTGGTGLKDPSNQASGYGGQILKGRFYNSNTTTTRRVKGYLIASGGSVSDATLVFDENVLPNQTLLYEPKVPDKYKDSATFRASQDAGTDVFGKVEAVEFY